MHTYPGSRRGKYLRAHPEVWAFIDSKKVSKYEDKKVLTNLYYCNNCNRVFVMPGWYTPYYKNARKILEKHLNCCKGIIIFYLIQDADISGTDTMLFEPSSPVEVWEIPDYWINAAVVADELL